MNTKANVFISYSRKDVDFVKTLHAALTQHGYDIWVDWEDIPLSAQWLKEIYSGIEKADTCIFVISPDSITSEVCGKEIDHAIQHKKRLMPVVRRDVTPRQVHPQLQTHNYLFFREQEDFNSTLSKLLEALNIDLTFVKQHTRLLVRALEWNEKAHNNSYLLRGDDLREAESWLAGSADKEPKPTEGQLQYIAASQQAATARQRALLSTAVIALVIISALAVTAFYQSQLAVNNAAQSQSYALISNAELALNQGNPNLALALAIKANEIPQHSRQVQDTLADIAYAPGTRYLLKGHQHWVYDVTFSPDGKQLLTGSRDKTMILWDRATGKPIRVFKDDHVGEVWSVSFSPDGKMILAATFNDATHGALVLWDVATGQLIRTFPRDAGFTAVVFSPDGKTAVASSADNKFTVWDIETGQLIRTFGGDAGITAVAFSPDRQTVISAEYDSMTRWDVETGLKATFANVDVVRKIAFSPDGQEILTSPWNGGILTLWDIKTKNPIRTFVGGSNPFSIAFSPDGHTIASGAADDSLTLWNAETGYPIYTLKGHTDIVISLAFSPDGLALLSGSWDFTARLWDIVPDLQIRSFSKLAGKVFSVAWTKDGQTAISGSDDGQLIIWDVETGTQRQVLPDKSGTRSVSLSSDGRFAVTSSNYATAHLWDVAAGTQSQVFIGHRGSVWGTAISPDEKTVLTGAIYGEVKQWDVQTGQIIRDFTGLLAYSNNPVTTLAFSPDGQTALSGDWFGEVVLWDVHTGQIIRHYEPNFDPNIPNPPVFSVAFSPDGDQIIVGSWDQFIHLYDVQTGQELRRFVGHTGRVFAAVFSPDGKTIASAAEDQTVILWDAQTGKPLQRFRGNDAAVYSVAFSADSQNILSGSQDGKLILWQVRSVSDDPLGWARSNRYIPELTCEERSLYNVMPLCSATSQP